MSLIEKTSTLVQRAIFELNTSIGELMLYVVPESSSLIVLAFHAVAPEAKYLRDNSVDPRYGITLDQFEQCVVHYLGHGYRAVSPADVLGGLPPEGRYVMFTFDDGYANNLHVMPVLERHRVPALFALATDYILHTRPFWWDVIFEKRSSRGDNVPDIATEIEVLIPESAAVVDRHMVEKYGAESSSSLGDFGRPMRPDEVRGLAKHPLVFWANHTDRHEFLPNRSAEEVRLAVGRAQDALHELTGAPCQTMVYPYGAHNGVVRGICRDLGLRLGFTMAAKKLPMALDCHSEEAMAIPRFAISHDHGVDRQCRETRIDWKPSWLLRRHRPDRYPLESFLAVGGLSHGLEVLANPNVAEVMRAIGNGN